MDKIAAKHQQLLKALSTLHESITLFQELKANKKNMIDQYQFDQVYRAFRESMIQRFEFCTELFWKYLKIYIENLGELIEYNSPATVIRSTFSIGILNEQEAENALIMIKDRNRTSHIYQEEIAEALTKIIPQHYQLMESITHRLDQTTFKNR